MGGRAALILVMGFGFIFGYIAIRINQLESYAVDNTSRYFEVTNSHNLAVAGANIGLSKLYQDTTLWNYTNSTDTTLVHQSFSTGPFANGSLTAFFRLVGGTTLRLRAVSGLTSMNRVYRDTVEVSFKRLSVYDILGYQTGFKGNDDQWATYDTIWGRVHFNGRIHVTGSPVFMDKAEFSKGVDPPNNAAVFMNGYETGVNTVPLPSLSDTADTFPYRDTTFYGDQSIQLRDTLGGNNDGFAIVRSGLHTFSGGAVVPYWYNVYTDPFRGVHSGVILVRGNVSVKGKVDGALTIAATGSVYIDSNIVYAADPQTTSSDDILGLVSVGDVNLYNQPAGASGADWKIQAIIASLTGAVVAQNTPNGWHANLRTYGGIVAGDRSNIASYNASGNRGGFYRRIRWDSRLGPPTNLRPPNFPVPDNVPGKLQIVNWWENVRIPQY